MSAVTGHPISSFPPPVVEGVSTVVQSLSLVFIKLRNKLLGGVSENWWTAHPACYTSNQACGEIYFNGIQYCSLCGSIDILTKPKLDQRCEKEVTIRT